MLIQIFDSNGKCYCYDHVDYMSIIDGETVVLVFSDSTTATFELAHYRFVACV